MKISKEEFMAWLYKEPLGLVWLPTLHRVATAETGTGLGHAHVCMHACKTTYNSKVDATCVYVC